MSQLDFESEARLIASRNLTSNVAGVSAKFDVLSGHLQVTYFLFEPPSDADEDERELTVGELVAAFPEIRTASSGFGTLEDMDEARPDMIFARERMSD